MKTGWAILVACISGLAISGCSGAEEEPPPGGNNTPITEKIAPIDGSASWVLLGGADAMPGGVAPANWSTCSSCHSTNAEGTSMIGPEVRHIPVDFATYVIRNGRKDSKGMQTGMVAFPASGTPPLGGKILTDAEVTELTTFLNSGPKPTTGPALYKDFCGNCHGPDTASGGSSGVKILAGAPGARIDAAVRGGFGSDPNLRAFYMPKFDATLLTDVELGLIKTFLGAK